MRWNTEVGNNKRASGLPEWVYVLGRKHFLFYFRALFKLNVTFSSWPQALPHSALVKTVFIPILQMRKVMLYLETLSAEYESWILTRSLTSRWEPWSPATRSLNMTCQKNGLKGSERPEGRHPNQELLQVTVNHKGQDRPKVNDGKGNKESKSDFLKEK